MAEQARTAFMPPMATGQRRSFLTPRQLDVLALLLRGETNQSIARQLGTAESTIKAHVSAILRVLRVSKRTEAAMRARTLGICYPQGTRPRPHLVVAPGPHVLHQSRSEKKPDTA